MGLLLPVLLGSVRSDRQGIKAARYIIRQLETRGHEPVLVDPLEKKLPLLDRMYKEYPQGASAEGSRGARGALPTRRRLRDRDR